MRLAALKTGTRSLIAALLLALPLARAGAQDCPPSLDFEALRAQLEAQGQDLAHVKIGFHAGPGGNHTGLGRWMRCLDAAGVPFFLKSVDNAGPLFEAARLKAASGVPHTLVYRRCCGAYELPNYDNPSPENEAEIHWQRHRQAFPPELEPYKHLLWVETINEPDKNRSEWLARFSRRSAELAMADGFNYAAFAWSSGEPEPAHWDGPEMRSFLELAELHPDRVAVALHEYSYFTARLRDAVPHLIGRFQSLFERADAHGFARPTVVITEFGWPGGPDSLELAMQEDFPFAADLYARFPQVKGAAIWYLGAGGPPDTWRLIAPMTEYALQSYFAIPRDTTTSCTASVPADHWKGEYWTNTTLSGSPAMVRDDGSGALTFDWQAGGPGGSCGLGTDQFSARWTRTVSLEAGTYRFTVTSDDGFRLYLDGARVDFGQETWKDQAPTTYTADVTVPAGSHTLTMEYYENGGGAVAKLDWQRLSTCTSSVPADHWKGEYWTNTTLSGSPAMVRDDGAGALTFDWQTGGPGGSCGLGTDRFSARWTRTVALDAGTYRFTVTSDDGFQLYLDGTQVDFGQETWKDQAPTTYTADIAVEAGSHTLVMQYYENGGVAVAKLGWERISAAGGPSIAGVHWYSGDSSMLDLSVPAGQRGFNVEVIFDVGWCDGDPGTDPGGVRALAATAKAHGLRNIIRIDYRPLLAVPTNPNEYTQWATGFVRCTQELADLASLYVVGNEPNIEDGGRPEGDIRPEEYAQAFNLLYSRKGEMPPATQLLATFNSPFTPPAWMASMSSLLTGVDGFALHTGGIRANCPDPRQPCSFGGWSFDGGFRYYRDVIGEIHSGWGSRPVYITEFNTFTGDPGSEPANNYRSDWINQAFEEVRSYNATRGSKPAVKALAWFVDRPQSWPAFALRNIPAARADMGEEFRNPANRGEQPAGGTGNQAQVLEAESSVPAGLAPGEKRSVRIRVQNSGSTTWRATSSHRLGTGGANAFTWSGFACGGYANGMADARAYLCGDVPPGATADFAFEITAPGGSGSFALAVKMVQDGAQWFGEDQTWTIAVGSSSPYPACACRSGIDNYCHIPPRTAGCPMTQQGGYCDPNGDGGYEDADWVRGYNEYARDCR